MNIAPAASSSLLPMALNQVSGQSTSGAGAFGKVIQHFIDDTNNQQLNADRSVELLATGQTESVHETMLALTKADLSLRVFMEVRDKVMDAYQEVMRMQL